MFRGRVRDEDGFTVIEPLIAMVFFAIVSLSLLALMLTTTDLVRNGRARSAAVGLATSELEVARATELTALAQGQVSSTRTVGGVDYTVTRDASFVPLGASGPSCGASGGLDSVRVTVRVSWPGMSAATQPVQASTLLTPTIGTFDTSAGAIAASTLNRDGLPRSGVTLTATSTTTVGRTFSQVTTTEGCALFGFLPADTYMVSASKAGYVDLRGEAAPEQLVSVVPNTTANVSFAYDQAATLDLTPADDTDHPAPAEMPFTLYNSAVYLNSTATGVYAGTVLPRSVPGLFPSLAGYVPWAGSCLDADPAALRAAAAVTNAGGTGSATVPVGAVEVGVVRVGPDRPFTLTATHAADAGCPSGETYTWSSPGGQAGLSLPFGTWTLTATDLSGTSAPKVVVLDPADTDPALVTVALP